jgi:hypothetical protein
VRKQPGETKVAEFETIFPGQQKVFRFQIPMNDVLLVHEVDAFNQLQGKALHMIGLRYQPST